MKYSDTDMDSWIIMLFYLNAMYYGNYMYERNLVNLLQNFNIGINLVKSMGHPIQDHFLWFKSNAINWNEKFGEFDKMEKTNNDYEVAFNNVDTCLQVENNIT